MKIGGLQKFSLLDYPEKICAIVFTAECNFRCPFCHNPSLVLDAAALTEPPKQPERPEIKEEEIFNFLSSRVGKLDGVCVTGGEPLLQPDIIDFIRRIHDLGFLVKLDTNGSFPDRLEAILNENLVDYVAMDIKNSEEFYPLTMGITKFSLNNVKKSANLLLVSDIKYEFRTTVVKELHTADSIHRIGRRLRGGMKYCIQNFKDAGNLLGAGTFHPLPPEEIADFKKIAQLYFQTVEVR